MAGGTASIVADRPLTKKEKKAIRKENLKKAEEARIKAEEKRKKAEEDRKKAEENLRGWGENQTGWAASQWKQGANQTGWGANQTGWGENQTGWAASQWRRREDQGVLGENQGGNHNGQAEHRKREEEYRKREEHWKVQNTQLQALCTQQQHDLKKFGASLSQYLSEVQRYSKLEHCLKEQLASEQEKYENFNVTTTTQIQHLQKKNQDYQSHISKLIKHGLPETHDDLYFVQKLEDLAESISQWARLFSRGQPPLTVDDLKTTHVTGQVREYFISAFLDIKLLLQAKNVGGKVRTRLVEAVMLRTLMGDRLWKRHIGFPECDYERHRNIIQKMSCTEEEIQAWSALTIHRLTKDNNNFQVEKEKDIDTVTDLVLYNLSPFGSSARATREKLRRIVSNVAELGLEIARLPFEIRPILDLKPGEPFVANMMKDLDPEEGEVSGKTAIILSYPWVKVTYDETGKSVFPSNYLSKARVSCIC